MSTHTAACCTFRRLHLCTPHSHLQGTDGRDGGGGGHSRQQGLTVLMEGLGGSIVPLVCSSSSLSCHQFKEKLQSWTHI